MEWNSVTFTKLFLKFWKDKKRQSVGKPTALKQELKEKEDKLKEKRKNKLKGKKK